MCVGPLCLVGLIVSLARDELLICAVGPVKTSGAKAEVVPTAPRHSRIVGVRVFLGLGQVTLPLLVCFFIHLIK